LVERKGNEEGFLAKDINRSDYGEFGNEEGSKNLC
jgi:hypothetical protein